MNLELNKVHNMDCFDGLKELEDNIVDSIVTDPPYGLSFMGKKWDYDVPSVDIWKECLRVLKPGGHLLSFAGSRTYHRMAINIEDSGFEIRDQIMWLYGSGFPKSLNIGKAIDKKPEVLEAFKKIGKIIKEHRLKKGLNLRQLGELCENKYYNIGGTVFYETGHKIPSKDEWQKLKKVLNISDDYDYMINESERDVVGKDGRNAKESKFGIGIQKEWDITIPKTDNAKKWDGWGTALKPAHEPIVVARKPLGEKTVASNVLKFGTGGINIDACRIGTEERVNPQAGFIRRGRTDEEVFNGTDLKRPSGSVSTTGRFPANIILDEEAGRLLDEQSGTTKSKKSKMGRGFDDSEVYGTGDLNYKSERGHNDVGGASRFFYCAKTSKAERNIGVESNMHPTVKPLKLMRYLVRLVTPKNGIVLDPFIGSGTTGMAAKSEDFNFIGFEREEEYVKIAEARTKGVEKD